MRSRLSHLIAVAGLLACCCGLYWQLACAHAARFSFVFVSGVFAVVCIHWLLEEFDLVKPPSPQWLVDDV